MFRFLSILLCLALLTACEQQTVPKKSEEKAPGEQAEVKTSLKTFALMQDPLVPYLFEFPSEALQIWRRHKEAQPALVLFSIHPFLQSVDDAMKSEVATLLKEGTAEDFYRRGNLARSNPLLAPTQTLSAALEAGYFSEIVWFFSTREELSNFSAETFQTQMLEAGFISESDPKLTLLEEGIIGGTLRGIPFRIVHPLATLPDISRPGVFHFDLSYFKGLYKNGVSTPVYNLLQEVALTLREANYSALDATLSYSTESGKFSVDTRFLVSHLAELLSNPTMLKADMPESWRIHKEALYSNEMYMESDSKKIIADSAQKFPDNPSFQHNFFQVLLQTGQNDQAFALLDKIVTLDSGYAQEYLSLAETAVEKGWLDKAVELLTKAESTYPENPFITLRKIEILVQIKNYQDSLPLIEKLKKRTWSQTFHPQMHENLVAMEAYVRNPPATEAENPAK